MEQFDRLGIPRSIHVINRLAHTLTTVGNIQCILFYGHLWISEGSVDRISRTVMVGCLHCEVKTVYTSRELLGN